MKRGPCITPQRLLCAALLGAGAALAGPPVLVDFGAEPASASAYQLANWVLQAGDHQQLPFLVVDKIHARVFVFNPAGRLLGASAALLGLARGDDALPGLGDRPLAQILPSERTTPAGRFVAVLGHNLAGQALLWVDHAQGISLHPVRSANPAEQRLQRLASPSVHDNRISYGCINVPSAFFHGLVAPALSATQAIVYVLPETRPLQAVFAAYTPDNRQASEDATVASSADVSGAAGGADQLVP
jgi:hypothetical protein